MTHREIVGEFFEKSSLTLDLVGLSETDRKSASFFLGGSEAVFVTPEDHFGYEQVGIVVFNWGDIRIINTLAQLFEHREAPSSDTFPFTMATVLEGYIWDITLYDKDFDPETAYPSKSDYRILPFNTDAQQVLKDYISRPTPRPQLLGEIDSRFVLFGAAIKQTNT